MDPNLQPANDPVESPSQDDISAAPASSDSSAQPERKVYSLEEIANDTTDYSQATDATPAAEPVAEYNPMDYDPVANPIAAPMPQSPSNASFVSGDVSQYQTSVPEEEPAKQDVTNAQLEYDPIDGKTRLDELVNMSPNIQNNPVEPATPAEPEQSPEQDKTEEKEEPLQVITVPGKPDNKSKIILVIVALVAILGTGLALYFAFFAGK